MARCTNRSVSFVERLELDFQGNHFCQALSLGDVDGDGLNEFIIGSVDGTMAIFKGNGSSKPWRIAKGLGTITCTGTGDIFNTGKIQLVCLNAAGECFIFSVYRYVSPRKGSSTSSTSSTDPIELKANYRQELHPNIKVILIANIAPDGKEELFVGRTDRVVNVYRWSSSLNSLVLKGIFAFEGQIGSLSVTTTVEGVFQLLVSQTGGTYIPLCYQEVTKDDKILSNRPRMESNVSHDSLAGARDDKESLVSMSVSGDEAGRQKVTGMIETDDRKVEADKGHICSNEERPVTYTGVGVLASSSASSIKACSTTSTTSVMDQYYLHAGETVGLVQRNNPLSSTEIVGELRSRLDFEEGSGQVNILALCTLDGAIRFFKDEMKVWEHQVDHNLFSISKLDITSNGQDEIVVCAWDGSTYILDHFRNVVRYKFEDNVCAFTAGDFGFSSEHNKPCLIYTTFYNKIYIYHNITLSSIAPSNLIDFLKEQESPDKLKTFMNTVQEFEKSGVIHQMLYENLVK